MNFPTKGDFNVEQDYRELYGSIENLIAQAKNGNPTAQADLGAAYAEGVEGFLTKDSEKAIGWLNTAQENGYNLPFVLGKLGELLDRKGTPQYRRKAYEMYHRAAELGCSYSQLNIAEMYRCGVEGVVNEDLNEAFKWYKKAAGESSVDVNEDLGGIGRLVNGMMKTMGNALDLGADKKALTFLYKYYLEGDCPEGRPQPTKAVHYLTRAAELGDTEAQRKLGEIYLSGSCEQIKDVKKARRWLGKASACGDAMAKQLLQQCTRLDDELHNASEISVDALKQSFGIMGEKFRQRSEKNVHPFAITQPVAFSEEMLSQYECSPTAKIYLQAYKLVKEGLILLYRSNFTDGKGISLIAYGFLTECSILQAFPGIMRNANIFKLCEEELSKNPCFFEGLLLSFALQGYESKGKVSEKTRENDNKHIMCISNLIHFIHKAEPDSVPPEEPFTFDKNYSSWLHVLYCTLAGLYAITEASENAAEAFENALKCCPSYYEAKRGLGNSLMKLYVSKISNSEGVKNQQDVPLANKQRRHHGRGMSKYASWTAEKLRDTAVKLLKEYLVEAPRCQKTYPNVYYYLAQLAFLDQKKDEFRKYFELGQDAEEKRLPFFAPIDLPLKDMMSPLYQLFANVQQPVGCGNRACIKKVKESDLKSCGRCGKQKYCSKDCQTADWKNHKVSCTASKGPKAKNGHT